MTSLVLKQQLCVQCGQCIKNCPQRILARKPDGTVVVVKKALERCIACGHCVACCTVGALTLNGIAPENLLPAETLDLSEAQRNALFANRRSIRLYKDQPVPPEVVSLALEKARYAPTASNSEQVEWILLGDKDKLHTLGAQVAEWMTTLEGRYRLVGEFFKAGHDPILRGAPALILAHGLSDSPWGAVDCTAAVSYLELALHSYGLGSCWAGFVIAAVNAGINLNVPLSENRKIYGGLMIGYPATHFIRVPPRKPVRLVNA